MSILSSLLSYHSQKKAAKAALEAEKYAVDKNDKLFRDVRASNTANFSPFMERGNAAGTNINALLGLGGDPSAAASAFQTYQGSTGHDYRLQQGVNALTQNNLVAGLGKSGKTIKDAMAYGQNLGTGDFNDYLGQLGNQQNLGFSGANALAGVNNTFATQSSGNNNQLSTAIGTNAYQKSNAYTNLLDNIQKSLDQAAGAMSSYGGH